MKTKQNKQIVLFNSFITEEEEQEIRALIKEEWEDEEGKIGYEPSNETVWERIREDKDIQIEDLQYELNHINTQGQLIAITDMGLWSGRKIGYKLLEDDLGDIVNLASDYDDVEIFIDEDELKLNLYHHDGTHHVTIREFKPELDDEKKDDFIGKILNGKINKYVIGHYTKKVGNKVKERYA